ncbi:hypothetical protein D3C72_1676650 [compost metagenome]
MDRADEAHPARLVDHGDGLVRVVQEVVQDRAGEGHRAQEVEQHGLGVGVMQEDQLVVAVFQAQADESPGACLDGEQPASLARRLRACACSERGVGNGGVGTGSDCRHPGAVARTDQHAESGLVRLLCRH